MFLLLGASVASANVNTLSSDPSYAAGPFSFYCQPYTAAFEDGKHYVPTGAPCTFSLPASITGNKIIALYKGVPGNATLISGDGVFSQGVTLVQEENVAFGTPIDGQDYFAVVWSFDQFGGSNEALGNYLAGGSPAPTDAVLGQNYVMLQWKWGAKPASEYDPVIIIPGILGSWEKNGTWVVDPILHTYDNLIDTFLANGYVENKNLFRFGYDWEEPNEVTAHILAGKIEQIKQTCGCKKVDIVAHSMGGLVALYYAENSEYKDDIDQLFLVATPLSGAPEAYKMWEGGVADFGDPVPNAFMQTKFWAEARANGYSNVYDYVRNRPIESIHELLPNYEYLYDSLLSPLPSPTNGFIEGIRNNLSNIYNRIHIRAILADNSLNNTIGGFITKPSTSLPTWEHGEPTGTVLSPGDGTVPRQSIERVFGDNVEEFDGVSHMQVVSTSTSYIFGELNEKKPNTIINRIHGLVGSYLYFKLFSPIDMQITAPDGKRLGKDLVTNTELNEIPDAFYSGFNTEDEYAVILNPLPGTYKVKTVGTGNGEYTIAINYADVTTSTFAEVTGSTTISQIIDHTVSFADTTVSIKKDTPTLPPAPTLNTDTCLVDFAKAYKDKWIPKKAIYDSLIFDCKALKPLLQTKASIERIDASKRTNAQKLILSATILGIKLVIEHMELLAKDRGNTKEGVELIRTYITWLKNQVL